MFLVVYILCALLAIGSMHRFRCMDGVASIGGLLLSALFATLPSFYMSFAGITDNDRYVNSLHLDTVYSTYVSDPLGVLDLGFELPGWELFNVLFLNLSDNADLFLAVIAFCWFFSSFYLINRYMRNCSTLGALLLYCTLAPLYAFSHSRQYLACALCNIAIDMYLRERKVLFLLLMLLASTVHVTAIILLLFTPLSKMIVTKRRMVQCAFVAALGVVCFPLLWALVGVVAPGVAASYSYAVSGAEGGFTIILKSAPYMFCVLCGILLLTREEIQKLGIDNAFWGFALLATVEWFLAADMYWVWRMTSAVAVPSVMYAASVLDRCERKDLILLAGIMFGFSLCVAMRAVYLISLG